MAKVDGKAREMFDQDKIQSDKQSAARAKLKNKEIASENEIFTEQTRELMRYFCSIDSTEIRQYGINVMREIQMRSHDVVRVEKYIQEILS